MDLESLDLWLEQLEPAPKVDGVSMLDGYLAAIVVGPCSIPPDEWFSDLLGAKGSIATAQGKRLAAIMAIVERFNAIGEVLSTAPSKYAPIFQRTDYGEVSAGPWRMGFAACVSAWKKDPSVECAPGGGQFGRFELTTPAGLPEDGSHDKAPVAQRSFQAASCRGVHCRRNAARSF